MLAGFRDIIFGYNFVIFQVVTSSIFESRHLVVVVQWREFSGRIIF